MREVKIKKYLKKMDYSYAMGFITALEILEVRPKSVSKVYFKGAADKSPVTEKIKKLCNQHNIRYEYNDRLINKIAYKDNTYVVAVFEKYQQELKPNKNHLVLVNPSDMGNLGTIIRSMAAFGFEDLAIIRPAADIFDPKVVSTTTGALFNTRFEHFSSFMEYKTKHSSHAIYPFMLDGRTGLSELQPTGAFALVFGNEGNGLPSEYQKYGDSIFIEQGDGTDSLNLAISVSIALYELSKGN